MFLHKGCWDESILEYVFSIETEQKIIQGSPIIFNHTHIPIDKMIIDYSVDDFDNDFISESELFDYIKDIDLKNPKRIVLVKGDTGTGKSELCEAVYHHFLNSDYIHPIIFTRGETNLIQIFNKLNNEFGTEFKYESLLDYNSKTIANQIMASLGKDVENFEKREFIKINKTRAKFIKNENLRKVLNYEFKNLDNEKSFKKHLISGLNDFKENSKFKGDMKASFKFDYIYIEAHFRFLKNDKVLSYKLNKSHLDDLANSLNEYIHLIIQDYQEIPPLNVMIEQIIKHPKIINKKRILIIIQDATGGGFKNNLIDSAFDLSKFPYDFLIAMTTSFVEDNLEKRKFENFQDAEELEKDNYIQRTSLILTTSKDNKTFFFNEENAYLLAKRYLTAIKKFVLHMNDESGGPEVIIEEKCQNCSSKNECWNLFGKGLYPFNKNAVINIYKNLTEYTPRVFLSYVLFKIISKRSIKEEIPKLKHAIIFGHRELKYKEFFRYFNLYSSSITEDQYSLDFKVLKWLGIIIPEDLITDLGSNFIEVDNKITIRRVASFFTRSSVGEITESTATDEEKVEALSKIEKLQQMNENFLRWCDGEDITFDEYTLQEGIKILINNLYPNFERSDKIIYNYSSRDPFSVSIPSIENRKTSAILVEIPDQTEDDKKFLILGFYIGLMYKIDKKKTIDLEKVISDLAIKVTIYELMDWVNKIKQKYDAKILSILHKAFGMSIEEFFFQAKTFLLYLLTDEFEVNFNTITQDLMKTDRIASLNTEISCPICYRRLSGEFTFYCQNEMIFIENTYNFDYRNLVQIFEKVEYTFQSIFKITHNYWDYEKLNKLIEEYTSNFDTFKQNILDNLRRIQLLTERYKIEIPVEEIIEDKPKIVNKIISFDFLNNLRDYFLINVWRQFKRYQKVYKQIIPKTYDYLNSLSLYNFEEAEFKEIQEKIDKILNLEGTEKLREELSYLNLKNNYAIKLKSILDQLSDLMKPSKSNNFFEVNKYVSEYKNFIFRYSDNIKIFKLIEKFKSNLNVLVESNEDNIKKNREIEKSYLESIEIFQELIKNIKGELV